MGYYDEVMADAPWIYYRLGEASGNFANSGSLGGSATAGATVVRSQAGIPNSGGNAAVGFNGTTTSWISQSVSTNNYRSGSFSVEMWLKIPSKKEQTLMYHFNSGWWISTDSNGFPFVGGGGLTGDTSAGVTAVDNQWHHLVITTTTGSTKVYLDGVLRRTINAKITPSASIIQPLYVSDPSDASGTYTMNGTMDEFAFYRTELSGARVLAHYNAGLGTDAGYAAPVMTGSASLAEPSVISQRQSISVSADTYVTNQNPNTSYGNATSMEVGGNNYYVRYGYFGVDTPRAPVTDESVVSAKLRVYLSFVQSNPGNLRIARVTSPWSETSTYNSRPTVATEIASNKGLGLLDGTWVEFDVTQIVNEWLAGEANHGIMLRYTDILGVTLATRESANKPELVVEYALTTHADMGADVATATGVMPEATVEATDTVSVGAQVMTAAAVLTDATFSAEQFVDVSLDAESMDASAELPGGGFAIPALFNALPAEATGQVVDASVSTTKGVSVAAKALTGTARWVQPALVNGQPIIQSESEDAYFQKVMADLPKTWYRLNGAGSAESPRVGADFSLNYVGVQMGQHNGPENRHSVHFNGSAYAYQDEPPTGDEANAADTTLEFSFRTEKANTFLLAGRDSIRSIVGAAITDTPAAAREMYLRDGKISMRVHFFANSLGAQREPYEFTGFKNVADGNWHHVAVKGYETEWGERGVEIWVDGAMEVRRTTFSGAAPFNGFPDYIGSRPGSIDGVAIGDLPSSLNFVGDMTEVVFYDRLVSDHNIPRHYYAFMGWRPVEATSADGFAFMTADNKGKGNQKRALKLRFYDTDDATFAPQPGGALEASEFGGYRMFFASVTHDDNFRPYRDAVTDRQTLLNLQTDINVEDFDVIMFENWPQTGAQIADINSNYPGDLERFVEQLRWANDQGVGLFITHPEIAVALGIVDRVEYVPALGERAFNTAQGNAYGLYDYGSAVKFPWNIAASSGIEGHAGLGSLANGEPQNMNPAYLFNKAYFYGDTNKNDRFRVRALIEGLTDIPSYMIQDMVYQRDYDTWGWQLTAYKYLHRMDGLQIGDEYIFHGTDEGTTLRSYADSDTKYQQGRYLGTWATPLANVRAGTVVTTFGQTLWQGTQQVLNPYRNYATTIVLREGDSLKGRAVKGRIYVNFSEQPSGQTETVAVQKLPDEGGPWPKNYKPDTNAQREWEWSDTRKTINSTTPQGTASYLSVVMPNGEVQSVQIRDRTEDRLTMSRSANIFPIEWYPSWQMNRRGLWWLSQAPEVNEGDVSIGAEPMVASGTAPNAAVLAERDVDIDTDPMVALVTMPKVAEDTSGDVDVHTLPMTAHATITGYGKTIQVEPMLAEATLVENFDAVHTSGEQVVLYLHGVDITLYIKEEA